MIQDKLEGGPSEATCSPGQTCAGTWAIEGLSHPKAHLREDKEGYKSQ